MQQADQFAKNALRDTLAIASVTETEVEVLAATQKIDVYASPDPSRDAERELLGLLGELSVEPSLFEAFSTTPNLQKMRRCLNKQLTWHHELQRRARSARGVSTASDVPMPCVEFPWLVVISPGRPETVLLAYECKKVRPGVYEAAPGLRLRIVVVRELPRTRETLLLRLLGKGKDVVFALDELRSLPEDAFERRTLGNLVVHFQRSGALPVPTEEVPVTRKEEEHWRQAWIEYYRFSINQMKETAQRKGRLEGQLEGRLEGRLEGERALLLRQLHARFRKVPARIVTKIKSAPVADVEQWGERILTAKTLSEVFADPS